MTSLTSEPAGDFTIRLLSAADVDLLRAMMGTFGRAFNEADTYGGNLPGPEYLADLLGAGYFIAMAAIAEGRVVGGLAAYELRKFEQERSEIYIYDLAVEEAYRRRGIATSLILDLKRVAAERGAYVVFVQADAGDAPAIALYEKLGKREEVLHFDIATGA